MASRKKDANAMIGLIQDFLVQDNPALKRSTTWNDQTNLAFTQWVKEFQAKHGITQTGNFGEKSLAALKDDLKNGKFGSEKERQFAQAVLDLNKGGVDSQNNKVSLSTLHSRSRAEATPIPVSKPADPQVRVEERRPLPLAAPAPVAPVITMPALSAEAPPAPTSAPISVSPDNLGIPLPDAVDEPLIVNNIPTTPAAPQPEPATDAVKTEPPAVSDDTKLAQKLIDAMLLRPAVAATTPEGKMLLEAEFERQEKLRDQPSTSPDDALNKAAFNQTFELSPPKPEETIASPPPIQLDPADDVVRALAGIPPAPPAQVEIPPSPPSSMQLDAPDIMARAMAGLPVEPAALENTIQDMMPPPDVKPAAIITPDNAPVKIEAGSVTDRMLEAKVSDPSETLDYITKHLYKNDKRGQGLSLMDAAVVLNQYAANDPDKSNPVINPDRLKEFAQANGIDMGARFRTRDPEQLATLVTQIAAFNSGKNPDEVSRQWGSEIEAASYKANHKSVPSAEEKASANPANDQTITVGTVLASLGDAIIPSAAASTTAEGEALLQAAAAKQQTDPVINIPLPEAPEGLIVTREVQPITDTEPTLKERASHFISRQFEVASASAGYLKNVALSHIKAALTGTEPEKVVPEYVEGLVPVPEAVDGPLIVNLENEAAQQAKTDPGLLADLKQTFTDSLTSARASASYLGNSLVSSIEGYFQETKAPEPATITDIERAIPTPDTSALPLIVEAETAKDKPETAAPVEPQQESGGWGLTSLFGSIASRVANVFKSDAPTAAKTQAFEFQQDTRAASLMDETQEDPASFVASQLKESGVAPAMRLTDAVQIVTALNSPDGQAQADAFATNFDASNRGFDISSRYDTRKTDQFQTLMTNLALFLDKTKMASDSLSEEQTRQIRSAVQPAIPAMAVPSPQPLAVSPTMS